MYIYNRGPKENSFLCILLWEQYVRFDFMGKERIGVKPRRVGLAHADNNILI